MAFTMNKIMHHEQKHSILKSKFNGENYTADRSVKKL